MESSKLKTVFVWGVFLVSLAFLGLAYWLHETALGQDPTATIACYVLFAVGCVCFIFGIVIFFIRHDLDI
ncbi:MAG TPA: hypothetical protein PKN86_18970 [Candidatus Obscuribacter sp.]|nr:hypothetical protein [Candidatus Melainabacteria bacterium]MBK8221428.1 hypothetical protein [Candidatus Obscuribacter sp.]MBK9280022.1 hypothetical protein [Candidatus Obscuribacter sp.]MDX1989549.1 hypothetical protein [Candidatus Obscuribacter sp.]HMW91737.1 hypothetical protein [Candidatus Obscuribacter sp.]